ncbi:MAG: hypothetical protein WAK31_01055 [Chthoniobacterales bacterium]
MLICIEFCPDGTGEEPLLAWQFYWMAAIESLRGQTGGSRELSIAVQLYRGWSEQMETMDET